jgi:hypothetical protein
MRDYTVEYFIEFFNKIPEEMWIVEVFRNDNDQGRCALGFCGCSENTSTAKARALITIFSDYDIYVTSVNDGNDPTFKQSTPKQRILAALEMIKEEEGLYEL